MLYIAIILFIFLGYLTSGIDFRQPRLIRVWPLGTLVEQEAPSRFWVMAIALIVLDVALLWFIVLGFLGQ